MSGTDNVVFNTLERCLSDDLNNVQSMSSRTLQEVASQLLSEHSFTSPGDAFSVSSPTSRVIGGLSISPSGTDVTIAPGILAQYSTTLSPVPGALDSPYRIGRNDSAVAFDMPDPVADTYYLIEAQVVRNVTANVQRDIFDPGTEAFVPTFVDKQIEYNIEFQLVTGDSNNFPVPTASDDWVLLGGILRPAGGVAVAQEHLFDMRPLVPGSPVERNGITMTKRNLQMGKAGANELLRNGAMRLNIEGKAKGQEIWFETGAESDPWVSVLDTRIEDTVNPVSTIVSNTTVYLYLCPWGDVFPRGQIADGRDPDTDAVVADTRWNNKGVLCLSEVEPADQGDKTNGDVLNLPAPFSNITVPAGRAMLVTPLFWDTSGIDFFVPMTADTAGGSVGTAFPQSVTLIDQSVATNATVTFSTSTAIPRNARSIGVFVQIGASNSGISGTIEPRLLYFWTGNENLSRNNTGQGLLYYVGYSEQLTTQGSFVQVQVNDNNTQMSFDKAETNSESIVVSLYSWTD